MVIDIVLLVAWNSKCIRKSIPNISMYSEYWTPWKGVWTVRRSALELINWRYLWKSICKKNFLFAKLEYELTQERREEQSMNRMTTFGQMGHKEVIYLFCTPHSTSHISLPGQNAKFNWNLCNVIKSSLRAPRREMGYKIPSITFIIYCVNHLDLDLYTQVYIFIVQMFLRGRKFCNASDTRLF